MPGLRDVIRWKLRPRFDPPAADFQPPPKLVAPSFDVIREADPARITITWIGHSTALVQIGGLNFLTDPIFGNCGPTSLLPGLHRTQRPGLTFDELPPIDAVLLSHAHYDHLDRASLLRLGSAVPIFCPAGLGTLLRRWGFTCVIERSWGEWGEFGEARIVCVPAQHGAARTPFDRDKTLWCGWVLECRGRKVYFAGDTGYAPFFPELAARFAPVEVALIPIGAYRPEWFMRPLHLNPAEAVKLHLDWNAHTSIAMHWGTFRLSDEPLGEPGAKLRDALTLAQLPEQTFRLLDWGETIVR